MKKVNYELLYTDFIEDRKKLQHGTKKKLLKQIDGKLTVKKLININSIIKNEISSMSGNKRSQQLKAYDYDFIKQTLEYQKENKLSDNYISIEFKLSRNTISKWKKHFGN